MQKRMLPGLLLGGLLACVALSTAQAVEVTLKFTTFPERNPSVEEKLYYPRLARHYTDSGNTFKRPAGGWKLPRLISKDPLFFKLQRAGGERLLVFDQQDEKDSHLTRLYFDANGNRDLTDDKPWIGVYHKAGNSLNEGVTFPTINCTVKVNGKEMPYAFQAKVGEDRRMQKGRVYTAHNLEICAACCYIGECTLENRPYRIVLDDTNQNGIFGEFASAPKLNGAVRQMEPSGDRILFTSTQARFVWGGELMLTNPLNFNNKIYDVALDLPAGKLTLNERGGNLVNIRIPDGIAALNLVDKTGSHTLAVIRPVNKPTIPVPAGRWRVLSYRGNLTDAQGNDWDISASGTGDTPARTADPQAENPLLIGPPFTARVTIPDFQIDLIRKFPTMNSAALQFTLMDVGGHKITDLRCNNPQGNFEKSSINPFNPKEPSYQILDSKGNVVTSGTCGAYLAMSGNQWDNIKKHDEYQILVKYQAGPFKTICEKTTVKF